MPAAKIPTREEATMGETFRACLAKRRPTRFAYSRACRRGQIGLNCERSQVLMPSPNWFFAFPLEGSFVLDLPQVPSGFRRFHPDDVHLTLAFLGGCGEDGARRALLALDERLRTAPLPALDVSLAEIVPMGPKPAYSALSALLGLGRNEATAYVASTRDVLTDAALVRREQRAPKPHVTVARPPVRANEARRAEGLDWARSIDLSAVVCRIDRIALYTWHENRGERLFRIVEERALG
jgi:2'-5' RNA ligase